LNGLAVQMGDEVARQGEFQQNLRAGICVGYWVLGIGYFDDLFQAAFVVEVGLCQQAASVGDAVLLHG
jgi:hypothetical protein